MNRNRHSRARRGQILALFLLMIPALVGAVGLAIEVGSIVTVRHEAQLTLDGAAFAATQALDWKVFYSTNQVALDQDRATALAGAYASMNARSQRYSVRVLGVYVMGNQVFVAGQVTYYPVFRFWGTRTWRMLGAARPAFGIEQEGQ